MSKGHHGNHQTEVQNCESDKNVGITVTKQLKTMALSKTVTKCALCMSYVLLVVYIFLESTLTYSYIWII